MSITKISQAFIIDNSKILMQLRDFNSDINFPGHWGFFAGHIKQNELPENTIKRELNEELSWLPKKISYIKKFTLFNSLNVYVYKCRLDVPFRELNLQEGQDMNFFSFQEILDNQLYSNKFNLNFPISPLSLSIFLKIKDKLYLNEKYQ